MIKIKKFLNKFIHKELDAVGVIEVILILVIIIGLVLIFRNQIGDIIEVAFESINSDASGIGEEIRIE
ncbi:MAG: putative Flagellin, Flp1-like, domain [Herbinix sp.]|jgi:Flp pilus assembly pilin Flp|nr:putative Flagellin, Flp1-like, domain [Herbinix sp.]